MSDTDSLNLIPDDWLNLIERSEFEDEMLRVNADLTALASSRLDLENPTQEEVMEGCAKVWNTTAVEVQTSWQAIIKQRATTRLFTRYYGHLFPKDENGELVLSPDEFARAYGRF